MMDEHQLNQDEDEISLLDIVTTLGKHKKIFLGLPVLFVIVAIIYSLVVTPKFMATATFMVANKSGGASQSLLASLGAAGGALGDIAGVKTPEGLYVDLLKSETVRLALADQFHLKERYKAKTRDDLLKVMDALIKIDSDKKSGLIKVGVTDKSPEFAAELANAHLKEVRKLMDRITTNQEQLYLQFLQQQIDILSHRALKDPAVQTQLLTQLINNYEAARMDEAQNQVVLNPVDVALPPERRSYPKRTLMILIAGLAGLFLGAIIAFIKEALDKMNNDPVSRSSMDQLKDTWWGRRSRG